MGINLYNLTILARKLVFLFINIVIFIRSNRLPTMKINYLDQELQDTGKLREIKKTVLFDTQMSHESHVEDKQFSPWIKKRGKQITRVVVLDEEDKKRVSVQFLAAIKRTIRKSPENLEDKMKSPKVHLNIPEPYPKRSGYTYHEIFKKDKNQQHSLLRRRFNHRINQVDLKLECDSCFMVDPPAGSEEFRVSNTREQFLNRQTKKGFYSQERKYVQTSQSKRYSIPRAQQIICKTIELNLPLQKNKRFLESRLQRQKAQTINMSFPLRPSPLSKLGNPDKQDKECNILGESIQLNVNQKTKSRRQKLRDHYQHQSLHSDTKIFLESYK